MGTNLHSTRGVRGKGEGAAILSKMIGKAMIILFKIRNLRVLITTIGLPSPIICVPAIVQPHEIEVLRKLRFMGNG
jgi:hypothetical protein